jgi:hypothetical protein
VVGFPTLWRREFNPSREGTGLREGLAACVARVGLVARVHTKVLREGAGRQEGLASCVAGVGLVAQVRPEVLREGAGRREEIAAGPARKSSFSRMYSNVHGQVVQVFECLATHGAFVHAATPMRGPALDARALRQGDRLGRRRGTATGRSSNFRHASCCVRRAFYDCRIPSWLPRSCVSGRPEDV